MKIGRAHPIVPSQKLINVEGGIANNWKSGYIKKYFQDELCTQTYPYSAMFIDAEGVERPYPLRRNEFEYVNVKPFDKNDWL